LRPPTSVLPPGLQIFPVSPGSQSPLRASSPPGSSIPQGCLSPQPLSPSFPPSHSPGPTASPPPLPDTSLVLPQRDSSPLPLGPIPQKTSPSNTRSLPSPIPEISIPRRSGCPILALSSSQEPPRALCRSTLGEGEAQGGHLTPQLEKASCLVDTVHSQAENGSFHFLNPEVQKVLEILITKKVELKICKNTEEEGQHISLCSLRNMFKSLDKEQDPVLPQQRFYPEILGDHWHQKGSELFWGLPILHSESLVQKIRVPDASLDFSPIVFNGLCIYAPEHIRSKFYPQHVSSRPLLDHVCRGQTLTRALPSCQGLPDSQKQT
ncbi:PREDICTED: spermatogenesis-associated protein 31E1-like, partial [Chinchilla lanigera]|uniref:spermatogenesis-associated protein 31E1-like n=1 Tax=Chinchilla lanigera TaxID=34839 RepID=UPI000697C19F